MSGLSGGMWDLVSLPGIWPRPSALGEQSLSHWITKKVLFFWRRGGSPDFSRHSVPNTWLLERRAILELRSPAPSDARQPEAPENLLRPLQSGVLLARRTHAYPLAPLFPGWLDSDFRALAPAGGLLSPAPQEDRFPASPASVAPLLLLIPWAPARPSSVGSTSQPGLGRGLSRSSASVVGTVAAPVSVTPVFSAVSLTPTNQAFITSTLCESFCILHCPQRFTAWHRKL